MKDLFSDLDAVWSDVSQGNVEDLINLIPEKVQKKVPGMEAPRFRAFSCLGRNPPWLIMPSGV